MRILTGDDIARIVHWEKLKKDRLRSSRPGHGGGGRAARRRSKKHRHSLFTKIRRLRSKLGHRWAGPQGKFMAWMKLAYGQALRSMLFQENPFLILARELKTDSDRINGLLQESLL